MNRFTTRIQELRDLRYQKIEENRKKKTRRSGGASSRSSKKKPFSFDSKELEMIFNSLPEDMKSLLKGR